MRKITWFLVATAILALPAVTTTAQAANLVTNGSFEADSFNTGGGYRLGLINNDVSGWFIPAGNGIYPWGLQNGNSYGAGPADTGAQWLVLGQQGTANQYTIQQTVTGLTPGHAYTLSWAAASELGCCATGQLSFLAGSTSGGSSFSAPNSGSYWTQWGHYSLNFVANSSAVTFQFQDVRPNSSGYDLGLDSVSLVAVGVPEPTSWAMMIIGLGLVGVAARRRSIAVTA